MVLVVAAAVLMWLGLRTYRTEKRLKALLHERLELVAQQRDAQARIASLVKYESIADVEAHLAQRLAAGYAEAELLRDAGVRDADEIRAAAEQLQAAAERLLLDAQERGKEIVKTAVLRAEDMSGEARASVERAKRLEQAAWARNKRRSVR